MSDQLNDGGPAFPMPAHSGPTGEQTYPIYGMSLRDWFAGQALAGLCADGNLKGPPVSFTAVAYQLADAMIEARRR